MRSFFQILMLMTLCNFASAQCLTDFTKLLPEPALDYTERYDRISVYGDYMAIGLDENDSLGRLTGLVYIYKKSSTSWHKIATLAPSDPIDGLQFGLGVRISQDYVLVGSATKVYLFKKSPVEWMSGTELTTFSVLGAQGLGLGYGYNNAIAISADQQTIAFTDIFYRTSPTGPNGAIFIYHKNVGDEWNGMITPTMISPPESDAADFGRSGIEVVGDRIITGTPFAPTGNGRLYVYRDASGEFMDLELEAKLSAKSSAETAWLGYNGIICTEDGIFATITTGFNTPQPKRVIAFYEKPLSGSWQDGDYTCTIDYDVHNVTSTLPVLASNGQDLIASSRDQDGKGYTVKISKGSSGWCAPTIESIDIHEVVNGQLQSSYAALNAISNNGDVVVGIVPHPDNVNSNLALKILSPEATGGPWTTQVLSSSRRSTAGHWYGNAILGFEDYMFVGAPGDGTVKPNSGAVYSYKKQGTTWQRTGKIIAPISDQYDDAFGTALATNGVDLAIGAAGFEEHGRVFIYRKKNTDWSDVEMVQEIELPEDVLTVFAYGDNIAMNDEWLLIPYVQNAPARAMLAIYKHDGTQWSYFQAVELGLGNLFSKFTTVSADIEGETIVAANFIIEWNSLSQQWEIRHFLSPSDPEPIQISPDFTHWITNGSMFGHEVDISENTIFISAPTKDDGSTWDVGAIYVYTKAPGESWSSRTETVKILPRVRNEGELFGYSMRILGNTLVAGAPGADFRKDGLPRNKPGRAYVFQTIDYFWSQVTPLLDVTGDSFVKDYFGYTVSLDETDFFIGAPIEDIATGKLSGSVYVTPAPPIIKLHPPVCLETTQLQLFGYPFGGVWSGPGITDASSGIVDVKTAGPGDHEFTYTTESCTYVGRLKVTIRNAFIASIAGESERTVCPGTQINIPLTASPKRTDYAYLWYYRANAAEPFFPINNPQAEYVAQHRGEYQIRVTDDAACVSISPLVSIKDDQVDIQMTAMNPLCEDPIAPIPLSASPAGGTWYGTGVNGNTFSTNSLANGTHTLTYRFVSATPCTFEKSMQVTIERIPIPAITRQSGHLCLDGQVRISTGNLKNNVTYTWEGEQTDAPGIVELGSDVIGINVYQPGEYWLKASDGTCEAMSNIVVVSDRSFPVKIQPDAETTTTCFGGSPELIIQANASATYEWYRAESADEPGVLLSTETGNAINANESGYYYAVVSSGSCEVQSETREVVIFPEEKIFIPNVFTPNGDRVNEEFVVDTDMDVVNLEIFNRYGKNVYSGKSTQWNGGSAPSGIYYWTVTVKSCDDQMKTYKGWVHLIR